jgi:mycothione reductase
LTGAVQEFDLVVVGTGSGNMIPGPEFDDLSIAIVEKGVFGGTCLNVGCIPSKMLVYVADVVETVRHAANYGISASEDGVDWPSIVERVFGRIDPIAAGGERYRIEDCPNITVFKGEARFTGPKVLDVDGEVLTGRDIVLGAGARPFVPPYPGLADVPYDTSDTIMRIEGVPDRLLILGGGYIAAELGHVFDAMGSEVTFVNRGDRLLRAEDLDISRQFTRVMARRFDLSLRSEVHRVWHDDDGFHCDLTCNDLRFQVDADAVLVATGRIPNGDVLDLDAGGIAHDNGRVLVDDHQRTNVEGVWAFGDLSNTYQLKHLANLEARVVAHNLLHPDDLWRTDRVLTPHAVFGSPPVAAVGLTEREVLDAGTPHVTVRKDYATTAYGWAMEDHDGFVKLIVRRDTRRLAGAHIIGAQAPTLLQQLVQGMAFGLTVDDMARGMMYIHPALTEVVENALLDAVEALGTA